MELSYSHLSITYYLYIFTITSTEEQFLQVFYSEAFATVPNDNKTRLISLVIMRFHKSEHITPVSTLSSLAASGGTNKAFNDHAPPYIRFTFALHSPYIHEMITVHFAACFSFKLLRIFLYFKLLLLINHNLCIIYV